MKLKDLLRENWDVKDGKVLSNGKLVGYYEYNRDSDSFWVDDVQKGKGQLSFDTKREVVDYFKKYLIYRDTTPDTWGKYPIMTNTHR